MANIQQFKQIRSSVSPEVQSELYTLLIQDLDTAVQRMIEIGNENEVSFTADEISSYLQEMDAEDEFDDIELDEATLAAVSGGAPFGCNDTPGGSGPREAAAEKERQASKAKEKAEEDAYYASDHYKLGQAFINKGEDPSGNNFM